MILTCPNCGTQYVVKDGAVPPEGRQVRCAACKHSWHQDPELASAPEPELQPSAQAAEAVPDVSPDTAKTDVEQPHQVDEGLAEASLIDPRSGPEAEERAYEEAVIEGGADAPQPAGDTEQPPEAAAVNQPVDNVSRPLATGEAPSADWNEPPTAEAAPDIFSPFADHGEVERRRRSPLLAVAIIVAIIIIAAALFWFLAPAALKAKLGVTAAGATPLQLVTTHMDRSPLESGNGELLTVTGRVINPSAKEQEVPPIEAQLKNHSGKVIYSWTIQPPAHSLAAGASASFNSAEMNVPPGADELTITLGEPQA